MRTAPENILEPQMRDGAWFAVAIVLGAVWGFSVEPVHLPSVAVAGTGLEFLGWMLVAVLCLCMAIMAWMFMSRNEEKRFGAVLLQPTPLTVSAFSPKAPPSMQRPEPVPQAESVPQAEATPQAEPAEIKDPFLAALDYLGHSQATVRIGGILALERWVRQGGDLQPCVGTLTAYVQQWTGADVEDHKKRPGFDVVAALAVLARLLPSGDPMRNLADLRRTHLAGLELPDADLSRFHLEHANLSGADLRGANFSGVNFRGADLRGALLSGAVFAGASLRGADLTGAVLSDDEFGAADLSMTGNISAAQLVHIRYLPACPPRLPAGMRLTNQNTAVAV